MSKGPESKVKDSVKKLLKNYDVYIHMPVLTGFGKPSLDFVCCYRGFFFAIETKAEGKVLTPKQLITAAEMEAAGGKVFEVIGDKGMIELKEWLDKIKDLC